MTKDHSTVVLAQEFTGQSLELTEAQDVELRKARQLRQLMGDPRIRVEVPTDGTPAEQVVASAATRYHIG